MPPPSTVLDYLQTTSAAMENGYTADCVFHACTIAELLLAAGHPAWIGRLHPVTMLGEHVFHEPLIPRRFTGKHARTWNTHYLCCSDGLALDPMLGTPIALDDYAMATFGKPFEITEHLSTEQMASLWRNGELRAAFLRRR